MQEPDPRNVVAYGAGRLEVMSQVGDVTAHDGHRWHNERETIMVTKVDEGGSLDEGGAWWKGHAASC